jgi:hypothetical protein
VYLGAAGNPEACYKLACAGASQTAPAGQSVTGGGGVILYDDKTGLGSEIIKRPAQRIHTNGTPALSHSNRSNVTLTTGGLSSPASASLLAAKIVDGPKLDNGTEKPGTQPVTNHFVAVYGYETDANGKIVGLYAKDNTVGGTADIGADGSITKPADPSRNDYIKYEYQLSEVKFHLTTKASSSRPTTTARRWCDNAPGAFLATSGAKLTFSPLWPTWPEPAGSRD